MHTFDKLLRSTWEWISMLLGVASTLLKSRAALQLENVALRHQIGVLQRSAKKRLPLNNADRLLWVALSRFWAEWRSALKIFKPDTVIAWIAEHFEASGPGKSGAAIPVDRPYQLRFGPSSAG